MIRRRAREIIELDVLPFGDVRSPADDACRRHVPAWRGGRDAVGAGDPRSQCSPIGGGEARYARAVRRWSSGVGASQCPVLGALHGRCRSRGGEDVIHDAADDGAVERAPFVRALFCRSPSRTWPVVRRICGWRHTALRSAGKGSCGGRL